MGSNSRTAVSTELGLGLVGPEQTIVPLMARTVALAVHVPVGVMAMLAMMGFILARAPSITTADRIHARF